MKQVRGLVGAFSIPHRLVKADSSSARAVCVPQRLVRACRCSGSTRNFQQMFMKADRSSSLVKVVRGPQQGS